MKAERNNARGARRLVRRRALLRFLSPGLMLEPWDASRLGSSCRPAASSIRSPEHPSFDNILRMAEAIEGEGYHSIWVGDSVTAKPRFEALTTLGAIAARTRKAMLGTSVLLSGLRNPVVLAHQVATLDVISRGRIILGVGVGGGESKNLITEFPASGVEYHKRAEILRARARDDEEGLDQGQHLHEDAVLRARRDIR